VTAPLISARVHHLIRRIRAFVAAEIDLPDPNIVDQDTAFTDLGLDSTGIVVVAGGISDEVGFEVPPEALFDFPTVRSLARHLAAGARGSGGT
jgi:acyl carrier protein